VIARALAPLALSIALLGGSASAQVHPLVPAPLPQPPPRVTPTSQLLVNTNRAILRAQTVNPNLAQSAAFGYVRALQQYRAGDTAGANASAIEALSLASRAQLAPVAAPGVRPFTPDEVLPETILERSGPNAPQLDANQFLAVARGALMACRDRHDNVDLALAQNAYDQAQQAYRTGNYETTRFEAQAAIGACGVSQIGTPPAPAR
jgi:hypothetical protein